MINEELANNRYVNEMTVDDLQTMLNTIKQAERDNCIGHYTILCSPKTASEIQKYAHINKERLFIVTDNTIFLTITEPTYTDESTLVIYKPDYGKAFNVNNH